MITWHNFLCNSWINGSGRIVWVIDWWIIRGEDISERSRRVSWKSWSYSRLLRFLNNNNLNKIFSTLLYRLNKNVCQNIDHVHFVKYSSSIIVVHHSMRQFDSKERFGFLWSQRFRTIAETMHVCPRRQSFHKHLAGHFMMKMTWLRRSQWLSIKRLISPLPGQFIFSRTCHPLCAYFVIFKRN